MPFALTLASLICILAVVLSGVASNSLYLFKVNTKDLSISIADLSNLHTRMVLSGSGIGDAASSLIKTTNITAQDLGLFDSYTISLWNYCYVSGSTTTCVPAKFDWASNATEITTKLTDIADANGVQFADQTLINSVNAFRQIVKWTEIVYIIAGLLVVAELVVGIFAFCSRIGSCCTFIVSGFTTTAVIAAVALSTTMSALVVGAVKALSKYNVSASFNTSLLAISWLAVAFSLAASLFWLFSICCCAPEKREKHRSRAGEKVPYGGYQRVNDPFLPTGFHGQETGYIPPTKGAVPAPRYEPYSHHSV